MEDRADRLNRRRQDLSQPESDGAGSDEQDKTVKTDDTDNRDNTDGTSETDAADNAESNESGEQSLSLTATRKEQMMHLPEDQHRNLHHRYNQLKTDYEYEFGGDFELNRHYFPLVIQYGLDQLAQRDIETVRDDLSSSEGSQ